MAGMGNILIPAFFVFEKTKLTLASFGAKSG
jgi:hypothetical protein